MKEGISDTETSPMIGTKYEVVVRKKVPYVTSFLFHVLLAFGATLVIIDIFFLPASGASDEMKTAYFILVIPEVIKQTLYISFIGFIIVLPLYLSARIYKRAWISFFKDKISIRGKRLNIVIPLDIVIKVYCMDPKWLNGEPREKLTIYFKQKDEKFVRVRLKYYVQAEEFMRDLLQYENLNFETYDFNVSPAEMDEE